MPGVNFFLRLRRLWCRHEHTVVTAKTEAMPAHVVCEDCGWREPVMAASPKATRSWDSTRDEARYEREKKRRLAAEQRRLVATAVRTSPASESESKRGRRTNVVEIKRNIAS
ncbi:MAG: hypothetical protein ABI652_03535 [Acidobacteriota bacterium]